MSKENKKVDLLRTDWIVTLEKLSLKEKLIWTFRIWFGMKANLKARCERK